MKALVALSAAVLIAAIVLDPGLHEGTELPIAPAFVAVGALIAAKRRENPIGWLYLLFGLGGCLNLAFDAYARHSGLPAANVAASAGEHIWHPFFGCLFFSLLLFPRGELPSPRWRWVAWVAVVTYVALALTGMFESEFWRSASHGPIHPLFHGPVDHLASGIFQTALIVNVLLLVVGAASLILRLRRARGEERQQVKWFVYTVLFVMVAFALSIVVLGHGAGVVLFPLIPISAAIAILKYHLYDIDVVIKRTLVYGALTAALGGAYLASVLLLQLLLSPSSDLAIAGSTLAVAALFRPLRGSIQHFVDRRFYRSDYDAQRTIESFGMRVRDTVSLEALSEELSGVVRDTMQPAHVSLWLVRR